MGFVWLTIQICDVVTYYQIDSGQPAVVTHRMNGEFNAPAQLDHLKRHGCEEAQGFLIAHPLDEGELRSWWRIQEELHQGNARQGDLWQGTAND